MPRPVRTDRPQPTWQQGYARSASESLYPHLWPAIAWSPGLGHTGIVTLREPVAARNGTFESSMTPDDWIISDGRYTLDHDGIDDYINLNEHVAFVEGRTTGSLTGWFKVSTDSPSSTIFSITDGANTTDLISVQVGQSTSTYTDESFAFFVKKGNSNQLGIYVRNGHTAYTDDEWHHYVISIDGVANTIYIDGVDQVANITFRFGLATTKLLTNLDAADSMRIGGRRWDAAEHNSFLTGQWDDVFHYPNRPLYAAKARQLYQIGRGGIFQRKRMVLGLAVAAPVGGGGLPAGSLSLLGVGV